MTRAAALWMLFCCALAAFGAAATLTGRSLWYDEGISVAFARLDWGTFWTAIHRVDAALAPYYALLHLWLAFGTSTVAVRSLSALAAIATVPLVFLTAQALFDRPTAAVAALLFATSPFVVGFAAQARPYALVLAAATLATLAFVRLVAQPRAPAAAAYALAALATIALHAVAGLLVVAHALSLPLLLRPRTARIPIVAAFAAIAAGSVPFALLLRSAGTEQVFWIPAVSPQVATGVLFEFAASRAGALLAGGALIAAAIASLRSAYPRPAAAVAVWAAAPLLLAYAISLHAPIFVARYLAAAFVPLLLLVARGVASLRPRAAVLAAGAAFAALGLHETWAAHARSYEDYRAAARFTDARAQRDDAVVVYEPGAVYAFRAGERDVRGDLRAPIVFPAAAWRFWSEPEAAPGVPSDAELAHARRVWLVMRGYTATVEPFARFRRDVLAAIEPRFARAQEADFANVSVLRFDRRRLAAPAPRRYARR